MARIFGQIDQGELAARLGSIDTFDRRGNIVWMDDFEGTCLNWYASGIGAGHSETLSAARSWTGSQSVKLVTGAVANSAAYIRKTLSAPMDTCVGVEMHMFPASSNAIFLLYLYGYTGTREYQAMLTYDPDGYKLSYMNSAGDDVELDTTVAWDSVNAHWVPIKLVIDWDNLEYKRILIGQSEHDLTGTAMQSTGSGTLPIIKIWLYWYTEAAAAKTLYIDNVIVTQNEP